MINMRAHTSTYACAHYEHAHTHTCTPMQVLNFGGAAIFHALEPGMAYTDAFYHCVMTATTIGLGDIAPQVGRPRALPCLALP